jgi:hypothetical protein
MVVLFFLVSGCATTQRIELDTKGTDRLLLVKEMTTDAYGRPVPGKRLKRRPSKKGKHYTAVLMRDGLPVRSFDIGITEPGKPDFFKPLGVLGTYTVSGMGVGILVGVNIFLGEDDPDDDEPRSDEEIEARGNLAVASVVAGTAVGLVVGFVKSVPVMAEQMQLLVLESDETLLVQSEYKYDALRRLYRVRRYTARGEYDRVVSTEFLYEGASDVPSSSETSSDYVLKASDSDI